MRRFRGASRARAVSAIAAVAMTLAVAGPAGAREDAPGPFPDVRPASRTQAESALVAGSSADLGTLSPRIADVLRDPGAAAPATVQAVRMLAVAPALPGERAVRLADGSSIRFTTDPASFDAVDPTDTDGDGLPDVLAPVVAARNDLMEFWTNGLALLPPEPVAVVIARVAAGADGYTVISGPDERPSRVVLDPADRRGGPYRAAVREFAFAAALETHRGLDPSWADAVARWVVLRVAGSDDSIVRFLTTRRDRWNEGLMANDPLVRAGNALWFAWLDEAWGAQAVRIALEELGSGDGVSTAVDRIARRAAGVDGDRALRDFQLWTLLTGERDDGMHLSFAGRLASPRFATDADWLPVISVQSDEPIAPLGGTAFRLSPVRDRGGMVVRFEGAFDAAWGVDLLLGLDDGAMHRVPIELDGGRGEVTVPLSGLREALVLIRNVADEDRAPARFTWSAHEVRGFPFELSRLDARRTAGATAGVLVSWDSVSEHRLLGYHVLRTPANGGVTRRVTPIWVPAIGDASGSVAGYQFLDADARPDRDYVYRVRGITLEGLVSDSATVRVEPAGDRP